MPNESLFVTFKVRERERERERERKRERERERAKFLIRNSVLVCDK